MRPSSRALAVLVLTLCAAALTGYASRPAAAARPGPVVRHGGAACPVFPHNGSTVDEGAWNTDISHLPVDRDSAQYIAENARRGGHVEIAFAKGNPGGGIPVNIVHIPRREYMFVHFHEPTWMVSSDFAGGLGVGRYPIPPSPQIERGPDAHLIVLNTADCHLYETWLHDRSAPHVGANNGAVWDLRSGALRRDGTTSADAAGLPIFPGLIRAEELREGAIRHALRFTMGVSAGRHIPPATHDAKSGSGAWAFPMGLRLRLSSRFDISWLHGDARIVAEALKHYGMFMADNGDDWTIDGADDPYFRQSNLGELERIPATAFEVVDTR